MKKLYAALCLASALFLSSCDAFLNPNNDKTPATSEYTKDNDVPAIQAPFDKNLCYQTADSLELSDGEWTIVMCQETPSVFNEKSISYATVKNNKETINSGILKIDIPFDSEEDSIDELPASEADFEAVFNEIQAMWVSAGYEEGKNYTFKKGYLTKDNTIVLILDATEINKKTFNLQKLTGTIKTNPKKTKYVITVTHEQSGTSLPVYIYKNANLNDKETIPENPPADNDNDKDDLTDIVKNLDYSECKTTLNLSDLSFADGDWEIVVDEEELYFSKLGTTRTFINATFKNNKFDLASGKSYLFFDSDYYKNADNKKTEFKADLDYFSIEANKILMDDNYLVAVLGDLTTSGLAAKEEFLSTSNFSKKADKIYVNNDKSKYKLTFGSYSDVKYTVYFNKVGGAEAEEPSVTPGEEEPEPESQEPSVTPEPSEPSEEQEPSVTPETPKPSEDQNEAGDENEEEENPLTKLYNSENDVPASKVPFDKDLCTKTVNSLSLTNGNWKIVDIALGKDRQLNYDFTTITDVTYSDGQYECTSSVSKFDFQRNESNESFDYKAAFDTYALNPLLKTFSHGYSTASTHVVIAKNDVQLFTQVYLAQLNTVPALSNKTGTKYVIPFTKNGYLQTIYIYKVNAEEESAEDLGYIAPDLPESLGTDPFAGKTFVNDYDKYVFGNDGTFTYYANMGGNNFAPRYKTAYTYNADTKLLTIRYIAMANEDDEFVTFYEYKQTIIIMVNQEMSNASEEAKEVMINSMVSMTKGEFEKVSVYKAEIVNNNLSLQTDYFTEVPDLKDIYLTNVAFKNNSGFEMDIDFYGESRLQMTGSLGTVTFHITRTYDTSTPEMQSSTSSTSTESFNIKKITNTTIEANGEVEIFWDGNHRNEEWNLSFTYNVVCNSDGTLTFTISGNDDLTKAELGATEENPNPSYELRSAGASILKAVTE